MFIIKCANFYVCCSVSVIYSYSMMIFFWKAIPEQFVFKRQDLLGRSHFTVLKISLSAVPCLFIFAPTFSPLPLVLIRDPCLGHHLA